MEKVIYLDYQATTPVDPRVLEAMVPYFGDLYGNTSSMHFYGLDAERAVENAKKTIADAIGAQSYEIFFTSGATEGNNLVLKGLVARQKHKHIVTVTTEHKSILNVCKELEYQGYRVTYLKVDQNGKIDLEELEAAILPETILISVMAANNEIGTINPIKEISNITKKHNVLFHCDATQAISYMDINVRELGIDLLTFSGHKIYGPKGVGVVYIKNQLINNKCITPTIIGGGQQRGVRAGTVNVPGVIGISKALELATHLRKNEYNTLKYYRDTLLKRLRTETDFKLNGSLDNRLPNNINLSFRNISGARLLRRLDSLALSSGSACNSGSQEPSHVLAALGLDSELMNATVRISLGRFTTEEEMQYAADLIIKEYKFLYRSPPD